LQMQCEGCKDICLPTVLFVHHSAHSMQMQCAVKNAIFWPIVSLACTSRYELIYARNPTASDVQAATTSGPPAALFAHFKHLPSIEMRFAVPRHLWLLSSGGEMMLLK
jgi:hypothetical protein